jgi:hypothetical protein
MAFRSFDWQSRRFFNTISAPIKDFSGELILLEKREKTALLDQKRIEKDISKNLSNKKLINALWEKRSRIAEELQYIEQRRFILQNLQGGETFIPPADSTWCTLKAVEDDVKMVFQELKNKKGLFALLDSAALSPTRHPEEPQMHILNRKLESFLSDPKSFETEEFLIWLKNSRRFWQRKLPAQCNAPFKFGAKDYSGTACSLVRRFSVKKASNGSDEKSEK